MRRTVSLILLILLILSCIPTIVSAASNNFATRIRVSDGATKWNDKIDSSGKNYDTVIVEYQLKGSGIKGVQGAWIAVDLTKLLWVDYTYDGYSVNDDISSGKLKVGNSPVKYDSEYMYSLKEAVESGRTTVDEWLFNMVSSNIVSISADGKTLYICPQPMQTYSVTYNDYTTVVSYRFAVVSSDLDGEAVRFIDESERDRLNQSFISLMNDGGGGYYYSGNDKDSTLGVPTVKIDSDLFSVKDNTSHEPQAPVETEPSVDPIPPEETDRDIIPEPDHDDDTPNNDNWNEPENNEDVTEDNEIWDNPFVDVPDTADYIDAIEFVYKYGLFKGVSDTRFSPDTTMTRAMFVTVLGRLAGVDERYYTGVPFEDVVAGEWYAPYVQWAAEEGIVLGYGNGKFGINDEVTVEQAVVIMARYANYCEINTASSYRLTSYRDEVEISDWAIKQMRWAVENKIYAPKSILAPRSEAKRSLVAEIFYAYAKLFK